MSTKKSIDVLIYSPTFEELKEFQEILPNAHLNLIAKEKGVSEFLYDKGTISIKSKEYSIRLISPQKAGQRSAQTLMNRALRFWNPQLVVLAGVAGSLRDAQIGDILLPRKIWIHDIFKTTPNGDKTQPDSVEPSELLVSFAERFFLRDNWEEKFLTDYFNHLPSELKPDKNRCFGDGNIVSSVELVEKHLEDSDAIKKYMNFDRKLYGIEQEAGAIGEALKSLRIPWVDIRVVMDLADPESRKEFKNENKQQASKLAADFTIDFLKYYFTQKEIPEEKEEEIEEKLIDALKKLEDKIHKNYPFKNMIVRYMEPSFYEYIEEEKWIKAKDQVVYKLKIECQTINDIVKKLVSVKSFLSSSNNIQSIINSKEPLKLKGYNFLEEDLAKSFARNHPDFRNNLLKQIRKQFGNYKFLRITLQSLFSQGGILLFLKDQQTRQVSRLISQFKHRIIEQIKESLNIEMKECRTFTIEELGRVLRFLNDRINLGQINELLRFLVEVKSCLEPIQNDLPVFFYTYIP